MENLIRWSIYAVFYNLLQYSLPKNPNSNNLKYAVLSFFTRLKNYLAKWKLRKIHLFRYFANLIKDRNILFNVKTIGSIIFFYKNRFYSFHYSQIMRKSQYRIYFITLNMTVSVKFIKIFIKNPNYSYSVKNRIIQ